MLSGEASHMCGSSFAGDGQGLFWIPTCQHVLQNHHVLVILLAMRLGAPISFELNVDLRVLA